MWSGTSGTKWAWSARLTPTPRPPTSGCLTPSSRWPGPSSTWSWPTSLLEATLVRQPWPASHLSARPVGWSWEDHQGSLSARLLSSGEIYTAGLSLRAKYFSLSTVAPVRRFMSFVKPSLCQLPSLFLGHLMGLLWSLCSQATPSLRLNMELLWGMVQFINLFLGITPSTLSTLTLLINVLNQMKIVYWTVSLGVLLSSTKYKNITLETTAAQWETRWEHPTPASHWWKKVSQAES